MFDYFIILCIIFAFERGNTMNSILDIIYEYSSNFRLLDDSAIEKIISIAKDELSLSNVKKVEKRISILKTPLATYNVFTESVNLYPIAIGRSFVNDGYKSRLRLENELDKLEKCFRKNLAILHMIFHELEHANQYLKCGSPSLEMELMDLEVKYLMDMGDKDDGFCVIPNPNKAKESVNRTKVYKRLYDISFMERMANVNAMIRTSEIVKELSNDKLEELYDDLLLCLYMHSYVDESDSPTKRFFREIKRNHRFANVVGKYELSYEDRLKYGLNLTSDEYQTNIELIKSKRI